MSAVSHVRGGVSSVVGFLKGFLEMVGFYSTFSGGKGKRLRGSGSIQGV